MEPLIIEAAELSTERFQIRRIMPLTGRKKGMTSCAPKTVIREPEDAAPGGPKERTSELVMLDAEGQLPPLSQVLVSGYS